MTLDPEFDFKTRFRQMILEQLAREAINGGSWKSALEDLKEIFEIDPADVEREIATLLELKAMAKDIAATHAVEPTDLDKKRVDRAVRAGQEKGNKSGQSGLLMSAYGEGVRQQVFEVVVRQGMVGAPWREICAGPMRVNNIDPDEIQEEIDFRMDRLNRGPKKNKGDDEDDDQPPKSGDGRGGSPKAPVPKKPFPFLGGAAKTLPLPGKKKDKSALAKDVKSHDQKSHDQRSSSTENQDDDEPDDDEK